MRPPHWVPRHTGAVAGRGLEPPPRETVAPSAPKTPLPRRPQWVSEYQPPTGGLPSCNNIITAAFHGP